MVNEEQRRDKETREIVSKKMSASAMKRAKIFTDDNNGVRNPNSDPIPDAVTIEILKRLPWKSIVRFLCVSEVWASIIRCPYFVKSYSRPRLLFTLTVAGKNIFFSAPHPQNSDRESVSRVVSYDMTCSTHWRSAVTIGCFVFFGPPHRPRISNPNRKQMVTLPRVIKTGQANIRTFFGYDPIGDQYKALCISYIVSLPEEHVSSDQEPRVLTVGADKSWRTTIHGVPPHHPVTEGLCLDGVIYYGARLTAEHSVLVSFDVRSEIFTLIEVPEAVDFAYFWFFWPNLTNYKGKLACGYCCWTKITGNVRIHMWVLEDSVNHKWSKSVSVFPHQWDDFETETAICFAGATCTGEIIVMTRHLPRTFYIFYYNLESSFVRRVRIDGLVEDEFVSRFWPYNCHFRISPHYVEGIKLIPH